VVRIEVIITEYAPRDTWTYATRTLTQAQFPFWSALIAQTQGNVSIPAGAAVWVDIQPPAGETWWIELGAHLLTDAHYHREADYHDYDGTTKRWHARLCYCDPALDTSAAMGGLSRVLTDSMYASIKYYSADAQTGRYGYSGFKLSQPLWSPQRVHNPEPEPWKRPKTKRLPPAIEALDRYAFDILGINPDRPEEYDLGVILEEDTPLATDPDTGFAVERLTAGVYADTLASLIAEFQAGTKDPVETGYRKYLDRWRAEGIDLGV